MKKVKNPEFVQSSGWLQVPENQKFKSHFTCPGCGFERDLERFITSLDRMVKTWCPSCGFNYLVKAVRA